MAAPTKCPFGTTALIYNPTGANANPIADGWTTGFFTTTNSDMQRLSNKIAPTSSAASVAQAYRAGASYGLGVSVWAEIAAVGAASDWIDIALLISSPRSSPDFYELEITKSAGTDAWDIFRVKTGASTNVATGGAQEVAATDYFCHSIIDDGSGNPVITGWHWPFSTTGPWTSIISYTDTGGSKITAAGFMGIEMTKGSAWTMGNIYGGTIPDDEILVGTFDPSLNPIGQF